MAQFKKIKSVTLNVLKLEKGKPRYVFLLGPMFEGEKVGKDNKGPATLVHAVDMETGEEGLVICPTVMQNELIKNYPGESYAGKGFELVVTRDAEKGYNHVAMSEVAPPDDWQRPNIPVKTGKPVTIREKGDDKAGAKK
jgi:hypothetical protein